MDKIQIKREILIKYSLLAQLKKQMLIVKGIKRSGKTIFLHQLMNELRLFRPPIRILFIGENSLIKTGAQLVAEAKALGLGSSALIIDDAEKIDGLKEALTEIFRKHEPFLVLSTSISFDHEKKIPSFFTPAYIKLYPFNYAEFLKLINKEDSLSIFSLYCKLGGLPDVKALVEDPDSDLDLSSQVKKYELDSFIMTEILEKGPIKNPSYLKKILSIAGQHIGESLSARYFVSFFEKAFISISPQSIIDYLNSLKEAGLIEAVSLFDIKKRKLLELSSLFYFSDSGYLNVFCSDEKKLLENVLYLFLIQQFDIIYCGRIQIDSKNQETVSFVCEGKGKRLYFQYLPSTLHQSTYIRKIKALKAIKDAWPKIIIANETSGFDESGFYTISAYELIRQGIPSF